MYDREKMNREFNTIRRKNLYEEVVNILKDAILNERYLPGQALPNEPELSSQLGVSRTVIREAIRSLQSRGFVEMRRGPKGGAYVLELNQNTICSNLADIVRARKVTIDHLARARLYLEPEISRLAAINATSKDLENMENPLYL